MLLLEESVYFCARSVFLSSVLGRVPTLLQPDLDASSLSLLDLSRSQIAAHFGAHVIGTTSTLEKAELARKNGAEIVVVGGKEGELQAAVSCIPPSSIPSAFVNSF